MLSVIKPGMGQMYNGELMKGLLLSFSATLINILVMIIVGFYSESRFLNISALLAVMILPLVIASEAAFQAAKIGTKFQLQKYNKWFFYIAFYFIIGYAIDYPISMFIKSNIVQAYRIPYGGMENTILVGDYLLANHMNYSSTNKPKINDIIIFKYFGVEEKDYIKRIIAESGQTIKIAGEDVFVDDVKQNNPKLSQYIKNGFNQHFPDTFKTRIPAPNDIVITKKLSGQEFLFLYHTAKQENENVVADIQVYSNGELIQNLPLSHIDNWIILEGIKKQLEEQIQSDSVRYNNILKIDGEIVSEYRIKNDNYFVMGDNRDNSIDSRYMGFVNRNSIKGKAKFLYMSIDQNEPFLQLSKRIRWNRIGKTVE